MKHDDVRPREERIAVDVLRDRAARLGLTAAGGQHSHAEGFGDASRGLADAAEAHDPHGLARKLDERIVPETPVGIGFPASGVHSLGVMGDVVADLQKQGDRKLPHGGSPVGLDVGDGDPFLCGAGDIHDVIACCEDGDVSQLRTGLQHGPADRTLVGEDDLGVPDAPRDLAVLVGCAVIDREIAESGERIPA